MGRCIGVEVLVPVISFVFVRSWHLGSGSVSAPLPCRSANAGLSDYKKKKKNSIRFTTKDANVITTINPKIIHQGSGTEKNDIRICRIRPA